MILNIVDRRRRNYRWKTITAIVEATCHDNDCGDTDNVEPTDDDIVFAAKPSISLSDAVAWAQGLPSPVTLYLYDLGDGIGSAVIPHEKAN